MRKANVILYGYDKEAGQIQFLLDNKNYGNPFDPFQRQTLSRFQQQLASAQVIKLFHARKLYRFQNQNAGTPEQTCLMP